MKRVSQHRDKNEPAIVEALEAIGATWLSITTRNGPDGCAGLRGVNVLLEIKNPEHYAKLRPGQKAWQDSWRGQVVTVETPEEAVAAVLRVVNSGEGPPTQ